MTCWASCLANCADGFSREHYVSDGVFDSDSVVAYGLPWCRDRPVKIGLKNAVAKILCGRHNEALSDFDNEASKLSRFVASNLANKPSAEREVTINGAYLEKWALKTFLNLGYLGALHRDQPNPLLPPTNVVRYIYENAPLPEGIGLYLVSSSIDSRTYEAGVSWNAIQNTQDMREVLGMTLLFYGVRFVLSIHPMRGESKISGLGKVGDFDYPSAQIVYRPTNIVIDNESTGRKTIHLQWGASEA